MRSVANGKEKRMTSHIGRRRFLGTTAASAAAFTIVPRHVLGGPGHVAPSDKLTFGYIGCGTEGLTEMPAMLRVPEIQVVAVCDPNRESTDYVEWGKDSVRSELATALQMPDWRKDKGGVPGGREVGREVAELFYANQRAADKFKGVAAYEDFRELLDEEDVDAVKVMTPDHLHATVAVAAMRKGKKVLMHKPLANRLLEARLVVDTTKRTRLATHFLPARAGASVGLVKSWIEKGAIGTLREIHNWSNRPVWPQYDTIPTDTPAVPKGFDWELWLGPSLPRPYHPHYTHAVFRGWYEFGGGAVADMGHYSLWPVFQQFDLDAPVVVETSPTHVCTLADHVSVTIPNDYSFPTACTIRFRFAAKPGRPALDLFWYDGGIKPATPEELDEDGRELAPEGMLFVGDKGKILAGFECEDPLIIPYRKAREFRTATGPSLLPSSADDEKPVWLDHFRGGPPTSGSFELAGPISDAFNLAAVSLRLGGKRLAWDAANAKITNNEDANRLLGREYRKGWELIG
jgi:predicted dehydrogenase